MHLYFKPLAIIVASMSFLQTSCSGDGKPCPDASGSSSSCVDSALESAAAQELPAGTAGVDSGLTNSTDNLSSSGNSTTDTNGSSVTGLTDTSNTDGNTGTGLPDQIDTTGDSAARQTDVPESAEQSAIELAKATDTTATGNTGTANIDQLSTEVAGLTLTPDPSGPFSKFQLDDVLYTNNVYDGRQLDASDNYRLIYYNGVQDYVQWQIPVASTTNGNPCSQQQPLSDVYLKYRLTSKKDSIYERNTFVRSFPAMVLGTMGGRYESWGVECGNTTLLSTSAQRTGNSPVYDMTRVAPETGFPVLAGDLDSSVLISVKGDIHTGAAANGIANVFVDSYWHNVSTTEFLPGSNAELKDTINGINSDVTETWNLNIWFDWPRHEGTVASWTGGFKIGQVEFSGDQQFDIYFKLEGSRTGFLPNCRLGGEDNCFLYIGLVTTDPDATRNGITLDYLEISNWLKSAEFRDLFLIGAHQTDTPNANAYAAWKLIDGTDNDLHPDPAARGPRFPDDQHVIGGLHIGSELWYNPDALEAEIRFSAMGVHVENIGTFGSFQDFR